MTTAQLVALTPEQISTLRGLELADAVTLIRACRHLSEANDAAFHRLNGELLSRLSRPSPRPYTASDIDSAPDGLYVMGTREGWDYSVTGLEQTKKCLKSLSGYWRLAYGPYPAPPESAYPLGE